MNVTLENLARELETHISDIISLKTEKGSALWQFLHTLHPAEVALVFNDTADKCVLKLLEKMDEIWAMQVFSKLDVAVQAHLISHFDTERLVYLFKNIPADELTTIFEQVPDKDLEKYLKLTSKRRREKIVSSLTSDEKSAGRILNSDALTLRKELTVKKVISLMQQLDKKYDLLPRQYVVNVEQKLIGYIELSDLLKNHADTKIEELLKPIDVKVNVKDHQEDVTELIKHYELFSVPVTDDYNHFLGVITTNDVLDVMEQEQTEESYKMSGIPNIEHSYASTDFSTIVIGRCKWLIPLLLFQSASSIIMHFYEDVLTSFGLMFFLQMLVGTGGNVGNQSATFFVRGLATGEINRKNKKRLFLREILIACAIGALLMCIAAGRIFFVTQHYLSIFTIIISLFAIVVTSVLLGTIIPLVLDYWQIDPANSAAPFISTLMDIIGVTIYCLIAHWLLR